ncbi:uncharacterized protein TRIADDRAFT_61501 [Trichoplax adhaerens]|uniref:G-protein coupled receptors family 1 profile domain-containing protein n=1 Tax=Trichoplax adhaerens TaxID=10228 RepID=B3SB61_TRIAD|nr:hypothetical protein TRIADDRAFT_61501 [Trichoplax adhaerens]EDV20107.1 hypothetical protein TRIADDRAFT_61501 [Trichoplax adhaerens]|eukprot:XP_002117491.1 hypothetical protein TRIADDRAFT_61501 [Trichoplax adhaerens]
MEMRNISAHPCIYSGLSPNCNNSSNIVSPKVNVTEMLLWCTVGLKERYKKNSTVIVNSTCFVSILYSMMYILPRRANPFWYQVPILCRILSPLGQAFAVIICIHLCLISLDRYFSILNPFSYKKYVTKKRVIILISIIWIASSAVCIVPVVLIFKRISTAALYAKCQEYDGPQEEKVYVFILFLALFSLPLIVSLLTYCHLTLIIQFHTKGVFINRNGDIMKQKQSWRRKKAYRQFSILLITFVIFFLPYITVYLVIKQLGHDRISTFMHYMLLITRYIAFFYPAIIPLLYAYFTADSKKKLQELSKRATRLPKRINDASDDRIRRCSVRERYI